MSQFLKRRVRLVNCMDAGKEGTTVSMHQKNGIPWIKVKLDNGREVGISDPSTLWFLIEKKEGVPAAPSGSPLQSSSQSLGRISTSSPNAIDVLT